MAAPKPRDPLDALQLLLNDVLVQTGKALRASRRDGNGNLPFPQGMSQPKLPDSIQAFHTALDEVESDIVKAKSVLLRDLTNLQTDRPAGQQQQLQPALPIESQTKEPISVDDDSSSPALAAPTTKPATAAAAPFPVMAAGDMPNDEATAKMEGSNLSFDKSVMNNGIKTEIAVAPEAPMMADAHFTDMEFSLAPADGTQSQNTAGTGSFDLSSFAPNESMLSLDNLIPNSGLQADANAAKQDVATTVPEQIKTEPAQDDGNNANDSNFENFFGNDASQADGMDFDFSIGNSGGGGGGGGMGEDTFDDLMNDRDGTFELMTNEDFDAAFFGLDSKEGS